MSPSTLYTAAELVLLIVLAIQCARVIWALFSPLDSPGAWKMGSGAISVTPATGVLRDFDPFFREADAAEGPSVVTSLNLSLFGVRTDAASGRGAAIIGLSDGTQQSYAIGDEIMPGVTLAAVTLDHVTISRGGAKEQIYLDQSQPAPVVSVAQQASSGPSASLTTAIGPSGVSQGPPNGGNPVSPLASQARRTATAALTADVVGVPRYDNGRLDGITVQPQSASGPFRKSGLQAGDVIVSIDGKPVSNPALAQALGPSLADGGKDVVVEVERGGQKLPIRLRSGS